MLEIREFSNELHTEYYKFCKKHIGFFNYQSHPSHISWLRANENSFFKVAINKTRIVGCLHGFRSPLLINGKTEMAMNLHNLYSDPAFKGIGMKLLMRTVREEDLKILAHATGKLALTYEKIGSTKVNSYWAKKLIFPKNIYSKKRIKRNILHKEFSKEGFSIINNKNLTDRNLFKDSLKKFKILKEKKTDYFIDWRFFHQNSPVSYLVNDALNDNSFLFSISKKGLIPYLRIYSLRLKKSSEIFRLLECVESFASSFGIPVIIISVTTDIKLNRYKYISYGDMPQAYGHSSERLISNCEIDGIATDVAFNSYF